MATKTPRTAKLPRKAGGLIPVAARVPSPQQIRIREIRAALKASA